MTAGWRSEARERERIAAECDLPASSEDLVRALDALDAVLALHTPRRMSFDEGATWTDVCITCIEPLFGMHHEPWPCPTVKAIEGLE